MSNKSDITFVTYAELPDLDPDDQVLVEALRERGLKVDSHIWSDASVDWNERRCIVRSTWDYPQHYESFLKWVDHVSAVSILYNDARTIKWNSNKHYLQDLESRGVDIIPTIWIERKNNGSLTELFSRLGSDIVVKPEVGLSSLSVMRVRKGFNDADGQSHLTMLLEAGAVMVQPFVDAVQTSREHALVYCEGEYSHCISKAPFQSLHISGKAGEQEAVASPAHRRFADLVLSKLEGVPLYARVDLVEHDGKPMLMELELVEPSLYFLFSAGAEIPFANAIVRRIAECR